MVRIVEDFWKNYHRYEEVIMSSIIHIVSTQFPNNEPQGKEDSIGFVLLEMKRLNIFEKWEEKRLKENGKSTDKMFENFLYQRIWSILRNEYSRRRKRSMRFKRMTGVGELKKECYTTPEHLYEDEPKIEEIQDTRRNKEEDEKTLKEVLRLKREKEKRLRHKRASKHPTIHDSGEIIGKYSLTDIDEQFRHDTMMDNILNACQNKREQQIITLRAEGLSVKEIQNILKISGSRIRTILKNIKDKVTNLEIA